MYTVSPATATSRFTSVGFGSSGWSIWLGDLKTTTSPRCGSAYPGRLISVNGTCGPYASLFTNSQSPTSSVGIMLPDGIRYASKRNVRMKKKIASVQTMALMLSIVDDGRSDGAALPPRRAATEFTGASD
jgi:hypothetical protein